MASKCTPCPILNPSLEEFNDPIGYLSSPEVLELGQTYGIVKIVPPENWQPPFSLSLKFKFHTRLQKLSDLGILTRSRNFFIESINRFQKMKKKKQLKSFFMVDDKKVYYYDLYIEVEKAGGFKECKWSKVNKIFGVTDSKSLQKEYASSVKNYADFLNVQIIDDPAYTPIKNGKIQIEIDSQPEDSEIEGGDSDFEEEDVKPENSDESEYDEDDGECMICGLDDEPESTLLCDNCGDAYHLECINLASIPKGDWYCNRCLVGTGEYGFVEETNLKYSVDEFYKYCQDFEVKYKHDYGLESLQQVEGDFWRFIELQTSKIVVRYGADIHNLLPGQISGFPTNDSPQIIKDYINPDVFDYYANQPFNLNNLPFSKGSLLNYVNHSISGMTIPWIYIGSLLSTFCWHVEDHYTSSANYCHFGATKKWYGIPSKYSTTFEKFMKFTAPDLFKKQPDLLHQLVTLVSPDKLIENGIPVYYANQNPNEFVITFPKVYHAGFNSGFNFNEAVNFTSKDWIDFGHEAIKDYRLIKKENVFNHYKLLENIMISYKMGIETNEELMMKSKQQYKEFANEMETLVNWYKKQKIPVKYNHEEITEEGFLAERRNMKINDDDGELCDICKTHIHHAFVEIQNSQHNFGKAEKSKQLITPQSSPHARNTRSESSPKREINGKKLDFDEVDKRSTRSRKIEKPKTKMSIVNHDMAMKAINEKNLINICMDCGYEQEITQGKLIVNVSPSAMKLFIALM